MKIIILQIIKKRYPTFHLCKRGLIYCSLHNYACCDHLCFIKLMIYYLMYVKL